MFAKAKTEAKTPAPQRELITLEEEARVKWKAAESELAAANGRLQAFVEENFRMAAGGLIYVTKESNRDRLDAQLRELIVDVDQARSKFHGALAALAKFGKDGTMKNVNHQCPTCGSTAVVQLLGRQRCNNCTTTFDLPKIPGPQLARVSGQPIAETKPS